jgi:serine/threonine-protein kinase
MLYAARMIGLRIGGRYELVRRLGSGGTSSVWRATDLADGGDVAVKILHISRAESPEAVARFEREGELLSKVRNPHVVRSHDRGEHDGRPFMVLDLVEGENLRERLRREGRLPVVEAVAIGEQVAAGLAAAHAMRVVHRDLKPANVLVAVSGHVTIVDFGISRALEQPGLTEAGRTVGTGEYVSPEQALGRPVDARSDLYSLGVLLFEMLAGRPPFQGAGFTEIATKHVRAPAPFLADHRPDAPLAIVALIGRCLAKDADDRPQRADLVQAELRAVLDSLHETEQDTGEIPVVQAALEDARVLAADRTAVPVGRAAPAPGGPAEPPRHDAGDRDEDSVWDPTPVFLEASFVAEPERPLATPVVPGSPSAQPNAGPVRWLAIAALAIALAIGGGVVLSARAGTAPDERRATTTGAAAQSAPGTTAATPTGTSPRGTATAAGGISPGGVSTFDPKGDGTERDENAALATDADPRTFWETEVYRNSPDLSYKRGVGLVLELDRATTVSAVRITTPTPGFTVGLYTSADETPPTDLGSWRWAADPRVTSRTETTLRLGKPVQARSVLVWVTRLAPGEEQGTFTARIAEATALP